MVISMDRHSGVVEQRGKYHDPLGVGPGERMIPNGARLDAPLVRGRSAFLGQRLPAPQRMGNIERVRDSS
jgi:hypothetical protein